MNNNQSSNGQARHLLSTTHIMELRHIIQLLQHIDHRNELIILAGADVDLKIKMLESINEYIKTILNIP